MILADERTALAAQRRLAQARTGAEGGRWAKLGGGRERKAWRRIKAGGHSSGGESGPARDVLQRAKRPV